MSYKVKIPFFDKADNLKPYNEGDSYSHDDEERIAFLIEKGHLEGGVISEDPKKETPEPDKNEFPKHSGGAYYELSNGEKVKGKEEAFKAQKELDKSGE
ncbi:hypothetical protein [Metabacillus halosaccharovorans]|uniref:hypothetical protein n=1 Tax=Metabacillus halosaccharovorans TaxID=930124 RepID=UPI0009952D69|nr:hypothetical protein [Metabacillus halosaccharovorans]